MITGFKKEIENTTILFYRELGFRTVFIKGFENNKQLHEFIKDPSIVPIKRFVEGE